MKKRFLKKFAECSDFFFRFVSIFLGKKSTLKYSYCYEVFFRQQYTFVYRLE